MKTTQASANRRIPGEPDTEPADARWGWLYRIGGVAVLFGVALVPIQLAVLASRRPRSAGSSCSGAAGSGASLPSSCCSS